MSGVKDYLPIIISDQETRWEANESDNGRIPPIIIYVLVAGSSDRRDTT